MKFALIVMSICDKTIWQTTERRHAEEQMLKDSIMKAWENFLSKMDKSSSTTNKRTRSVAKHDIIGCHIKQTEKPRDALHVVKRDCLERWKFIF